MDGAEKAFVALKSFLKARGCEIRIRQLDAVFGEPAYMVEARRAQDKEILCCEPMFCPKGACRAEFVERMCAGRLLPNALCEVGMSASPKSPAELELWLAAAG